MDIREETAIREIAWRVLGKRAVDSITRLGGLTNLTFRVDVGANAYVFRLPGAGTESIIDRRQEKISTQLADRLGIDAPLVFFDADTGVKVSVCITDGETLSPLTMQREDNLRMAAQVLRRLHGCGEDTGVPFDVFEMAAGYEAVIRKEGGSFYPDYPALRAQVLDIRTRLGDAPVPLVPCHNDPLCENWLRAQDRMYLIDWEYAGMNDAMWDVADVAIEAELDEAGEEQLLRFYLDGDVPGAQRLRFYANEIYLDFLWSLWGKTRAPFDASMEDYARNRYQRMKKNLMRFAGMRP